MVPPLLVNVREGDISYGGSVKNYRSAAEGSTDGLFQKLNTLFLYDLGAN